MERITSGLKYLYLLVVPLLVLVFQQNITKNIYISDPDYAYILNGLNLNVFRLPLYSDHPGVPLTMLSAIGTRIIYWFSGSSTDIQSSVLINPAYYEIRLQLILFLLIICVSVFAGYFIFKKTKNIYIGIIAQAIPLLFSTSLVISSANYMPDAVLIIILHLFLVLTVQYVVKYINTDTTNREEWLFPVLCGLALSVKIIILPILVFPILMLRMNFNKIFHFLSITLLSFIVFTLPIVKQYPHMLKWFWSLLTHSGIYGGGSKTIINPDTYFKNILFIITGDHLMTLMMILTLLSFPVIYYIRKRNNTRIYDILVQLFIAAVITLIVSILIVSKTYDGKSYYLIVTYALTAVAFVVASIILIIYFRFSKWSVAVFLTCFLAFSIMVNFNKYHTELRGSSMTRNEYFELQKFLESHADYNTITNNAYSLNKNQALLFGLAFSRVHEERLMQLYPKAYFFNVLPGRFSNWYREVPAKDIFINGKAYLVDNHLSAIEKFDLQNKGYTVNMIFSNRTKAVYELNETNNLQDKANYQALIKAKVIAIYRDEKWLNTIRVKAMKNSISLDSMVYLDAKWMVDTYGK